MDEQFLASPASIFSTSLSSRSHASVLHVPSCVSDGWSVVASGAGDAPPTGRSSGTAELASGWVGPAGMLSKHQARWVQIQYTFGNALRNMVVKLRSAISSEWTCSGELREAMEGNARSARAALPRPSHTSSHTTRRRWSILTDEVYVRFWEDVLEQDGPPPVPGCVELWVELEGLGRELERPVVIRARAFLVRKHRSRNSNVSSAHIGR